MFATIINIFSTIVSIIIFRIINDGDVAESCWGDCELSSSINIALINLVLAILVAVIILIVRSNLKAFFPKNMLPHTTLVAVLIIIFTYLNFFFIYFYPFLAVIAVVLYLIIHKTRISKKKS